MNKEGDAGVSGRSMTGKLGMRMITVLCRCEALKGIKIPVLKDYPTQLMKQSQLSHRAMTRTK